MCSPRRPTDLRAATWCCRATRGARWTRRPAAAAARAAGRRRRSVPRSSRSSTRPDPATAWPVISPRPDREELPMPDPDPFAAGAAFVDGDYVPIGRASVSVLDWGFNKSDVTYDVVHVWNGAFLRLGDHLARFAASMAALHMQIPPRSEEHTSELQSLM